LTSNFAFDKISSMRLTKKQRENLSKNIFDVGKLILAVVVLGQLVSEQKFRFIIFFTGIIFFIGCFIWATILDRGE